MTTSLAKDEMRRFWTSGQAEVLCVHGDWGVGKTFAWNEVRTTSPPGKKPYSYVSLFGLGSIEDVKQAIVEGSDVSAGVPLFRIDSRTYKAALDSARADVAVARLTADRYKPLLDIKAISQQEYDIALAKLKQAEAVMARAELDYENASVPAPIGGRIGRALVTEGALVGKGEATPLATIEQLDPIYANFTQSSGELLRLRKAIGGGKLKQTGSVKVDMVL